VANVITLTLPEDLVEATASENRSTVIRQALEALLKEPLIIARTLTGWIESGRIHNRKNIKVGVSINVKTYEDTQHLAARLDFSVGQVIRIALEAHLQNQRVLLPQTQSATSRVR
jgi:metal-responsive CopG/Arc/MetJ family transcriptional regulator